MRRMSTEPVEHPSFKWPGVGRTPSIADGLSNARNQLLSVCKQEDGQEPASEQQLPSVSIISYHINSRRIYAGTVRRISDSSEEKKRERICGYLCQSGLCPMQSPTSTRSRGE
ncbi:hypothetical protein MAP00_006025 [Monascus purpureus]|nr:hypothetical protein MAP00_006025 [Monascus purpureus]